ncbi:putative colanic acid biosynthesis acetyltransferase [Caballeronia arvi]|nr:putative colanic acid biosynthesis acetyltransferase [Caballeronia arvi]
MIQDLREFRVPRHFRGASSFKVQIWWLVQASLFRWSPQVMYGWRRGLLRVFGAKIGKSVIIRPSATVTYPWKLAIGDFSWIGDDVVLYSLGQLTIGSNSVISQRSYLCGGDHDYRDPAFPIRARSIQIGDQVWIGTDVFVGPGTSVGKGAVIGARSTVVRDIPPLMVCVGSPARPIKHR